MGNWLMVIRGKGPHFNQNLPEDADKMLAKFIKELKDAGQVIDDVQFASSPRELKEGD